jgi:DNA polymerase (family 10)
MPVERSADQNQLDAEEVARLLRELGQRIELSGDSPFKARAYFRAAEALLALTEPLAVLVAEGRLRDISGVGTAIAEKIETLHRTGQHRTLERLRQEAPASALGLLTVPGLNAQKARLLFQDLKIDSLDGLEEAARGNKLAHVRGVGPALQAKILQGIDMLKRARGQRLLHHAGDLLAATAANLAHSHPELDRVVPAGDFRRGCELVHELALVARTVDPAATITQQALNQEIDLLVADPSRYGVASILATGSESHVRELQAFAAAKGFSLGLEGLKHGKDLMPCADEADVYRALGLPSIAAELREGAGEIAQAAQGSLPDLVEAGDISGILHCHTNRSDGVNTLEEMAQATRQRGFSYFGVADHSRSAGYAGGLSVEEIEAQHAEADALNRRYRGRFQILKGIESDILADGSLDYPDEILSRFDFVVASVHSRFRLEMEAQTERILRAVRNPYTTILGHMTGRLLLRREGYDVDIEQVLKACAQHGVAVEINANPHRLDLDWRWHRRALELGCMLSINPDAHSTAELDLTRWGVTVARKGGVPKSSVLNCMGLKEITSYLHGRALRRQARGQKPARAHSAHSGIGQFEMTQALRVGLIGAGAITRHGYLPALKDHPRANVVAICSGSGDTARRLADEFGIPHVAEDYVALLRDHKLDAVTVATPNALHAEISIAAMQAGAHVLCEKPMATAPADAERMVRVARETGKLLALNHTLRLLPELQMIKQRADANAFGPIRTLHIRVLRRAGIPAWEAGSPARTWPVRACCSTSAPTWSTWRSGSLESRRLQGCRRSWRRCTVPRAWEWDLGALREQTGASTWMTTRPSRCGRRRVSTFILRQAGPISGR